MKRIIKRMLIVAFLLTLTICFASCGENSGFNDLMVNGVENNLQNGFEAKYSLYTGSRTQSITVKEGETLDVHIRVKTDSGSIKIDIFSSGGQTIFSGNEKGLPESVVHLTEAGTYKVVLHAEKHKGSYSICWEN